MLYMTNTLLQDTVQRSKNSLSHVQITGGHVFCWSAPDNKSIFGEKYDNQLNELGILFKINESSTAMIPDMYRTQTGFAVVFTNVSDEILVRFYDDDCKALSDEIKVNTQNNKNTTKMNKSL